MSNASSRHRTGEVSSSIDSRPTVFQVKRLEIPVHDFDRARLFYTEALGFQSWDADYPLPSNYEILFFRAEPVSQGYFLRITKQDLAALIIIGSKYHKGYQRVIFVSDIDETKKRILAAGGELFEYGTRLGHAQCLLNCG